MDAESLNVASLRDMHCGSDPLIDKDANNAAFAACVVYLLGAVDMIREWQKARMLAQQFGVRRLDEWWRSNFTQQKLGPRRPCAK